MSLYRLLREKAENEAYMSSSEGLPEIGRSVRNISVAMGAVSMVACGAAVDLLATNDFDLSSDPTNLGVLLSITSAATIAVSAWGLSVSSRINSLVHRTNEE